ncbi:hypothetical protein HU200_002472 [Digitaria exilis]|uniref:Uncharacterized protein n=1 Tax=Digitaria exilis TaxID=1010633 RepID=A0A835FWN1_9POAL|nr:hypothetical protein HU200_002472 [Digitaria exilis]
MPVSSSYDTPPPQAAPFVPGAGAVAQPPNKPPGGEPASRPHPKASGGLGAGGTESASRTTPSASGATPWTGAASSWRAARRAPSTRSAAPRAAATATSTAKSRPRPPRGSPAAALVPYGSATPHHQFSPYYRNPGQLLPPAAHHMAAAAPWGSTRPRPLALPSTTSHSGRDDGDDLSGMAGVAGPCRHGPADERHVAWARGHPGRAGPGRSGSGPNSRRSRRTGCWRSRSGWGGASRSTTRPPCSSSATRSASSATCSRCGCTTTSTPRQEAVITT